MSIEDATDYLAGMTDRFALTFVAGARVVARIKDESLEKVKAAIEIVLLVEDVVRLRKAGIASSSASFRSKRILHGLDHPGPGRESARPKAGRVGTFEVRACRCTTPTYNEYLVFECF